MRKSWLMCVLLPSLAWGQAQSGATPPASESGRAQAPVAAAQPAPPAPDAAPAAEVAPTAAVLTIKGVCPAATSKTTTAAKSPSKSAANCEIVITRAQFEKLASGISPNMTPQLKRQLASVYPRLLAMSREAEKRGLQNTPRVQETMKFARMQVLTSELQRRINEEAGQISDADIAAHYQKDLVSFQQYSLERLYVPRYKQAVDDSEPNDKDKKDDEAAAKEAEERAKAKQEQGEQDMSKLAETLHARAEKGEDFIQLQKEAFEAAGTKVASPTVAMPSVRRAGLPPGHVAVFDLKPGEISAVISDAGGHYVYKMVSKEQLKLDDPKVKDEIRNALQNERMRAAMEKLQNSFHTETNEAYFGPATPAGMRQPPTPHSLARPRPGMQAQPEAQPAPAQQPPASQPPPSQPN